MRSTLVLLFALLAAACGKKSWAPFYELQRQSVALVDGTGDSAYDTPAMDVVIAGLEAAPENSLEKERAVALVADLKAKRTQVHRHAEEAKQVRVVGPVVVDRAFTMPVDAGQPQPARDVDAGPMPPVAGMPEKDFIAQWGRCFTAGPGLTFDGGAATAWVVNAGDAECQLRFGAEGQRVSFVFIDARLWGTRSETNVVFPTVDAGQIGSQPEESTPRAPGDDGGGVLLLIPGAPLPEGLRPRLVPAADAGK